jgi:membrane-bound serine protease (ClpP class)
MNNPGLIYPAAIGVVALIAVLVGSQLVSLNALGFLLIALGFVLFFLEIKFVSYGLLTLGGVVAIVGGFYLLVDEVTFAAPSIDWRLLGPALGATLLIVGFIVYLAAKSQQRNQAADPSDMVGLTGEAITELNPKGRILALGTFWTATADTPIAKGEAVRIVAVDGLRVTVEAVSSTPKSADP